MFHKYICIYVYKYLLYPYSYMNTIYITYISGHIHIYKLLIYPSVRLPVIFQTLTIMALKWMWEYRYIFEIWFCLLWILLSEMEIARSYVGSNLTCWREFHIILASGWTVCSAAARSSKFLSIYLSLGYVSCLYND